jgi:glycogen debranching enzyme
MSTYLKHNDQYYILSSSSLADDRIMVLKQGDTFAIYDRFGDIHPIGKGGQGVFHEGTRFLSKAELLIEGQRPLLLSSSLKVENEVLTVDLANPDFQIAEGLIIEKGALHFHRTKFLWEGVCYERIQISNFNLEPVSFNMSLCYEADFTDIFEVRGMQREKRGEILEGKIDGSQVLLQYNGLDNIKRTTRIRFSETPKSINTEAADFNFTVQPQEVYEFTYSIAFEIGPQEHKIYSYDEGYNELLSHLKQLKENTCDLLSSQDQFNSWLSRSKSDLNIMVSKTDHGNYPYAGVPWFSCPFGRDGIITAIQCLWNDPVLAKGVLGFCAATQAKDFNDFQDAEPGKIFHEQRGGEMAELGEIPFKMYYGTIDATPLFIILAGMYYERTNDIEFIKSIWPNIEAALTWIDEFGDSDGDGFVEYKKKSERGLLNQGWKDSHDSIMYDNGQYAEGSIALCEVQAYVYDAKMKAADLADDLHITEKASNLRKQAEELQVKFLEKFWDEEKETFILALDGNKKPCKVVSSNAGHALFSRIALREHADKLSKTLMSDKMFSGWGIRTLSKKEVRYNPMSYHNGSIWPHDNAMIAIGLAHYGYPEAVHKIMEGLFEMTKFVDLQRLPELFCGFEKRPNEGPTAYPVACAPQAWAVGSVYMLIQACLGLFISAKDNSIYFFKPSLPDFLHELTIKNLRINSSSVALQVRKDSQGYVTIHVLHKEGNVRIEVINDYLCSDRLPEVLEKSLKIECKVRE